ncbi:MAG TPA: oligosaccharide flippase family protein, partial [Kofleriaceae bacterium]|nr:oligosaccharide flippase family protein [Kofleriaceae bacterium]
MSLATRAVRGATWTVGSSITGRAIGVAGTLALTHFLAPDVVGEVSAASILIISANQLSTLGLGQYIVAKPHAGAARVFHAAFLYLCAGALALATILLFAGAFAPLLSAPDLGRYTPGLVGAVTLDRIALIPERVLLREMRFGEVAATRTAAEIAYSVTSVALAAAGFGGFAIVLGNIARSALRCATILTIAPRRAWLSPTRLRKTHFRPLLAFGIPISIGASLNYASRKWDNLLMAALFGPAQMGLYNLAYNLADIPASQVGEHIGDVLLPSFAHMGEDARKNALARSAAMLALVVFPLATGLAAVAHTLVATLFGAAWQGLAPYLVILSSLSVVRPVGWLIQSYLQAEDAPRAVMVLEAGKVAALITAICLLGLVSPLFAAAGAGIAFTLHAVASLWV